MGNLDMPNRIVMALLTRRRAGSIDHVPTALQAEYYAQRATAGLIVAEATAISPEGYADSPRIMERGSGARMAPSHRRRACCRRPHHCAAMANRRYCPSRPARRFATTVGIRCQPSLRVGDASGPATGAPLAEVDWKTVYVSGPRGYSDYPAMRQAAMASI
jgi:NADH:flavin oxidoreductase / NADH oxidase family